jgi:hypothetical protein
MYYLEVKHDPLRKWEVVDGVVAESPALAEKALRARRPPGMDSINRAYYRYRITRTPGRR